MIASGSLVCRVLVSAMMGGLLMGAALAQDVAVVAQHRRAFSRPDIQIRRGSIIQFRNDDNFLHQVYVDSPGFRVTTAEQAPGSLTNVRFPTPGTFIVRCEIHPKMMLTVSVQ